jgi:hypothetical protein
LSELVTLPQSLLAAPLIRNVKHIGNIVSDCVEMYKNGQGENVALFWYQICCGVGLGDSQPLAITRDTKKTDKKTISL